jgi:hypothetical protein
MISFNLTYYRYLDFVFIHQNLSFLKYLYFHVFNRKFDCVKRNIFPIHIINLFIVIIDLYREIHDLSFNIFYFNIYCIFLKYQMFSSNHLKYQIY